MIKNIFSTSKYLTVNTINNSNYFSNQFGAMNVGDMRYNTTIQRLEVYDGNSWVELQMGFTSVGLTPEVDELLDWAREQRNKQLEFEALSKSYPAIAAAVENLNKAKEQLEVTVILSKETT